MDNGASNIKNFLQKSKRQFVIKFKETFLEQNRRFMMVFILLFAVALAGINLLQKSQNEVTVSANDSSILVSLLYGEGDIETVTNETPVTEEKRLSPVTVASAAPLVTSGTEVTTEDGSPMPASVSAGKVLTLGSDTLVKTNDIETKISTKPREKVIKYTVKGGDTVTSIAKKFSIDEATVLEENKKYADDFIKPGEQLSILPISGTTERVDEGETLDQIAKKHQVDLDDVMAFNKLESADSIEFAQILVIPDGKRESKNKPLPVVRTPDRVLAAASSTRSNSSSSRSSTTTNAPKPVVKSGSKVGNRFPWGWCTWYVAQKRGDVSWRGNAGTWLNGARGSGRSTGKVPAVGAIMVTSESGYGHVAYVEAVNGDKITVSEMNYRGFGVVSSRTVSAKSRVIKGYVY
ncbi:LysM peptidoglycan-binding domain-containing protein [Patescibacteria group bacterium]|nr:LysM peptidoglycan-binding domain-containing protein [Patescibacteria group bacterium]